MDNAPGPMERRRIDEVRIALRGGNVVIPWGSREALLEQLRKVETLNDVRDAFRTVGTTQPVSLTAPQKAGLMNVITLWADRLERGWEDRPEGIHELRHALYDDLHDVGVEESRPSEDLSCSVAGPALPAGAPPLLVLCRWTRLFRGGASELALTARFLVPSRAEP